jgi:hypothetical protein
MPYSSDSYKKYFKNTTHKEDEERKGGKPPETRALKVIYTKTES